MDDAADRLPRRRPDAGRTRLAILEAAREEFAQHGLSGARVDAIAARTNTVKRMIYYYFGSKDGLYLAVLEAAYADIRRFETELDLDRMAPVEALVRLVAFTFDYDEAHPDFIRLVVTENMLNARTIAGSGSIRGLNRGVIDLLGGVLARGRADGSFRLDPDPVDVHLLISSFCFFRVSNRHTFGALFDRDLTDPALRERHKRMLVSAVLDAVGADRRRNPAGTPASVRR